MFIRLTASGHMSDFTRGELIYSKLKTGEFPDEEWVLKTVGTRLKK